MFIFVNIRHRKIKINSYVIRKHSTCRSGCASVTSELVNRKPVNQLLSIWAWAHVCYNSTNLLDMFIGVYSLPSRFKRVQTTQVGSQWFLNFLSVRHPRLGLTENSRITGSGTNLFRVLICFNCRIFIAAR